MSDKKEDTKEKSVEDILVEAHSKFLETIGEVYPLAVLGSLCIAISAFTQQSYPQAQAYALTGASLFLIAFVCSFASKIAPSYSYFTVVISYFSTALGTLMLFLVTIEFSKTIPMVNKAVGTIPFAFIVVFLASFCYSFGRIVSKTKNRFIRSSLSISIIACVVFICLMVLLFAVATLGVEMSSASGTVFAYSTYLSVIVWFVFFVIAIPSIRKERKKAKSSKEHESAISNNPKDSSTL